VRLGVVVVGHLLHLAVQSPTLLLGTTVVPDRLEALAVLYVGESLSFIILAESDHKVGELVGALHLFGELAFHVFINVTLNEILHLQFLFLLFSSHFNY